MLLEAAQRMVLHSQGWKHGWEQYVAGFRELHRRFQEGVGMDGLHGNSHMALLGGAACISEMTGGD